MSIVSIEIVNYVDHVDRDISCLSGSQIILIWITYDLILIADRLVLTAIHLIPIAGR